MARISSQATNEAIHKTRHHWAYKHWWMINLLKNYSKFHNKIKRPTTPPARTYRDQTDLQRANTLAGPGCFPHPPSPSVQSWDFIARENGPITYGEGSSRGLPEACNTKKRDQPPIHTLPFFSIGLGGGWGLRVFFVFVLFELWPIFALSAHYG